MKHRAPRAGRLFVAFAIGALGLSSTASAQPVTRPLGSLSANTGTLRASATGGLDQVVTLRVRGTTLTQALGTLVRSGVSLLYSSDVVAGFGPVRCECENVPLRTALRELTRGTSVRYRELDTGEVLLYETGVDRRVVAASIRGTVVALDGNRSLGSARVHIVGSDLSTTTNDEGGYLLTGVPAGSHVVRVELIGYKPSEQRASLNDGEVVTLNFTLATEPLTMDPLEVTASTGTVVATERRKIGHAIEIITEAEIAQSGARDITELLRGRVAGLTSTPISGENGAGSEIQIRGATSFLQDQTPLIYVDGIPVDAGSGALNRVGLLNSDQNQTTSLHARLQELTVGQIERIEVVKGPAATTMYGTDAMNGVIQIFTKRGVPGETRLTVDVQEGFSTLNRGNAVAPGSQYEEDLQALFKNPRTHRYAASVTGGSADLSYSIGVNYDADNGVVIGNDASTTTVRTSFRSAPLPNLTIQLSGSYVDRGVNTRNYRQLFQFIDVQQTETDFQFSSVEEALRDGRRTSTAVNRFYAGATVAWAPITGWNNRLTVGLDNSLEVNETLGIGSPSLGYTRDRAQRSFDRRSINLVSSLAWPRTGFVTSTFSAGVEGFSDDLERLRFQGTNMPSIDVTDFDEAEDLRGGGSTSIPTDLSSRAITFGAFAQEMIGLGDRAYITLGVRADGNSAFGDDYGMQVYPKVSASYLVKPLGGWDAKFRAAWGRSGKAPDPYAKDLTFLIQRNLSDEPIERLARPGNVDLKPELGSEFEVGIDNFFGAGRSINLTYFRQTTRNALLTGPIPLSTGFAMGPLVNIGELRSQGVEVAATAAFQLPSRMNLRVGLTAAHMIDNGLVVSLGDAYDYLNSTNQSSAWRQLQGVGEGESVRDLSYGTPWDRTLDDAYGDYRVVGSRVPTTTGGINFTLIRPEQFTLNAQMVYGLGGKSFDYVRANRDMRYGFTNMCCWYVPDVAETRYIYRTDFAKLSLARLTYNLPASLIDSFAREGEVYVEGHNLLAWDLFPRGDPEANSSSSHTQGAVGAFNYVMPMPQRYAMGLRFTLGGAR